VSPATLPEDAAKFEAEPENQNPTVALNQKRYVLVLFFYSYDTCGNSYCCVLGE